MSPLIGGLVSIVSGWMERRNRVAEARTQAQIENAGKVIENSGWKDGYALVIWSMPAILAFLPGMNEYAQQGFENLRQAPEWYVVGWVSICLAIYGIKPATASLKKWREGSK